MANSNKKDYEAPLTLVFEVKSEGIICASGDPQFTGFRNEEEM